MTHGDLVKRARAWLARDHALVISEMASVGEQADAIGFSTGYSTLIECKANRADYLSDLHKYFRRIPEKGMGDRRYYFTSQGIIRADELPGGWGLLEVRGKRIQELVAARHQEKNARMEITLLVSALRRLPGHVQGVSVRYYQYESKNRAVILAKTETDQDGLVQEFPAISPGDREK